MKKNIYALFDRGIRWNAFESLAYQSILTLHQVVLFYAMGHKAYGLVGVLYSLLYLSILILNFGFDKSLMTFFELFTKNKSMFRKVFLKQFVIQLFIVLIGCLSIIVFNTNVVATFTNVFKTPDIGFDIWVILSLLIVFESVKKSLRYLGELSFLNKEIAITELFCITLYVSIFWISYLKGYEPTLFLIFAPHLIQSIIGTVIFIWLSIKKVYNKLPSLNEPKKYSLKYIVKIRSYNFALQLSHLLFSGNFIIPFLSSVFGFAAISFLKLANSIAIYFTVIFERTFGLTSGALLSQMKDVSTQAKQNAINMATQKFFLVFYAAIIFLILNFKVIFQVYYTNLVIVNWLSIYFFLIAIIFENFFIIYEQFFIVEEKSQYLFLINSVSALVFYGSLCCVDMGLDTLLLLVIAVRVTAFFIMRSVASITLDVKLPYKISFKYIIIYLLGSYALLLILKKLLNI